MAIFLKLAENENFNKIVSLPVRERIRMKRFSFPSPFPETRNSELLLLQVSAGVAEEINGAELK